MEDIRTDHPSIEKLAAFGLGRLSEAESQDIELHLADCEACRRKLQDVPDDALVRLLQSPGQSSASEQPTSIVDPPGSESRKQTGTCVSNEQPDIVIAGKYKLLQQIGEGGMGTVWMADQTEPVKRRVAVKLIRTDRGNSRSILARFEAERQAIALMDHPHIARLLDAGATATGQPYFVMELVKGVPLTDYCDKHRLSVPDRLAMFQQICSALQHAHQKGIIHRDLKPSNILVESHDGKPTPKVIDFGLAKATSGLQLTEHSLFTAFGSVMGTPLYMAPEQATFNALDVDTRADIYSLGVILYELLTGTTPLTRESMEKAALDAVLKLVREEEAPTPSSRLSSTDALPSVAANRQTEPAKLGRFVKGELDWIVLKALSKERDRRYETANGFAQDIERFLNHEPVTAGPASARYRLRKFARKHRTALATATAFVVLLAAGAALSTWQAVRATQAETTAVNAAAAEKEAHEQARKRLAQIEKSNEIITSIFTDVDIRQVKSGAEPLEAVLAQRLVKTAEQLEGEAVGDPLVVAGLQERLGLSLLSLGYPRDAIPLFVKARETRTAKLGPYHLDTLQSMHNLAKGYQEDSKPDLAVPLLEEVLPLRKAKLGANHPDTLTSMSNLASNYSAVGKRDLAVPLHEEVLKLRKAVLGADHPDTLQSMNSLAVNYQGADKLDLAASLHEETLKLRKVTLGADHVDTLASMNNLASVYKDAGKLNLALPLLEETVKLKKAKLGAEHPEMLASLNNLALGYKEAGKLDLALPLFEETLKLMKARLGVDHRTTFAGMINLASSYQDNGKMDLAQPLYEEAMTRSKAKLGHDHPFTLISMNNLAMFYQVAGKLDQALPLYEETLQLTKEKLGTDHSDTHLSMGNLAMGYRAVGKLDLAVPLLEETLKLTRTKLGSDHPSTFRCMNNLAMCYRDAGKLDQALPVFEEALQFRKTRLGADHPYTLTSMNNLGMSYRDAGKLDLAAPLCEEALQLRKAKLGLDHPDTLTNMINLAKIYFDFKQPERTILAENLLRECLAICEKARPESFMRFETQSLLGASLLAQKKYADAEPLLLKGYEGLKAREKTIAADGKTRLREALDRLIQLATATNSPDDVKKWQAEREKYLPTR